MIIKSTTRQDKSFLQLMNYLNRNEESGLSKTLNTFARADQKREVVSEFMQNAKLLDHSQGKNYIYHDIISISDQDFKGDRDKILIELAEQYIEQRTKSPHLVYMKIHTHTKHPHIHLMISANPIDSKRRLRLTKGELSQIQRDMEFVARDLGLNEKNIYNKERQPNRKPEKAQQIEAVRGKVSNLEKTAQTVKEIVNLSCSHIDMEQRMMDQGYEIYKRGNTIGIKSLTDGRKYRFKRLDPELTDLYSKKIEQFNREKNREQNLRDKYRKMKEKSLERDVSRDMDMDI